MEHDVRAKHSKRAMGDWRPAFYFINKPPTRFRHLAYRQKQYIDQERRELKENPRVPPLPLIDNRQRFRRKEILSSTNNFSDKHIITKGALGKVYKGQLLWNKVRMNFMVRKLDCTYGLGDELQTEFSTVKSLKHKNIISILGYNDEKNEKIIVYKQAVNGTLDQHLTDASLTWFQRLQICLGVARALSCIHYDIIHCDINSSKIFLDEDWEPKIYGFELSTKYPQSWRHRLLYSKYFNTDNMTPEYDVYSFGVLLLEVLCGRKPMITNDVIKGVIDEIINPWKQINTQSLALFKDIAYNCLNRQLLQRPTMDQVVKELEDALELESKHAYLGHSIAQHEGTSFNILEVDFLKIPLIEIKRATNNFHDDYFVGSGGYGIVYKAELDVLDIQSSSSMEGKSKDELPKINKVVAIKRILHREDEQGKQGFLSEIELLTICKHPNIVSLLGFSREDNEMILVYEYAFKGSLSDYLGRNCKTINLTWAKRIQICLDIAHGINYIHTDMKGKRKIIHRDIKSENILLDENLHAKVADFGLSTFHPMRQQASTIYTQNIVGTAFYMDPEYLKTHKYKRESDIYSFGVVLFEVLSGSLAYDAVYTAKHEKGLAHIARRCFNEGTIKELIDPKMIQEDDDLSFTLNRGPNQTSFNTFSEVAYRCLAETQAKRPTMEVVIKELQKALELQGETMVLSRFQLSDIELATKNFAATYCIGLDTDRKVYKAELDHVGNSISSSTEGKHNGGPSKKHIIVAIKCIMNRKGGRGREAFFEELEMRTSYKHPNIVSLMGFCYEVDRMILVYEHASKSSLDDYLKSADNMKNFTWTHRLHMCLEIACGLNHLHTKIVSQERLFHGDIKSANILLGMNCEAKIAYFGISKHPMNQELATKVYADPDYETTGKLERHSDIYSFGVVLFEILCGRVAYSPIYMKHNEKGLAPIARKCFNDGTIERIIDPKLMEETDEDIFTSNRGPNCDSLNTFLKVACQCLGEAVERPTMEMVINELEIALNFHENLLEKLQISLNDIKSATENFSEENHVGSGGFWKAYIGELPLPLDNANASGRTTIVAKRWDNNFGQRWDYQFLTILDILFKRMHKNVIKLVGYCHEMDEKIIILEHMSQGSLDKYLKDANLTWMKRIGICIDIASGLEFLHSDVVMPKKVVHRDIRSASILLNDDWRAKISNLESSSFDSSHQDMEHVGGNATASGYLDPQHKKGFLTEKSDIYSFGVVLFEILCGRLAWTEDCKDHAESLVPLAKRFYEDGKVDEIVFEGIKEQLAPESLSTFAGIAYQCLHDKSEERPTARELVIQLKKALDVQEELALRPSTPFIDSIQIFKRKEILSSTNNFSDKNIITKGALGNVYKGQLLWNGDLIKFMVRQLDCTYGLGDELQKEISTVNSVKHKNIISILGYNDENNEKIIVYEQAVNGTLDQHLTDQSLTWFQRLQICLGVARALSCIHYDIIHCDINSSKIFLDEDWEPKIYGFELSTKHPQSWRHRLLYSNYFNTDNMTPEYDVYSFGVLLLEVLCGRKPMFTNDVIRGVIDEIIDPHLRKQISTQSLVLFKDITYNCLNRQLVQCPTMDQIVKELENLLELESKHSYLGHSIAPHEGTSFNILKVDFLRIPLIEIKRATNNFHYDYYVGSGGYGMVYKAELDVLDIQSFSSMEGKSKDELPKINKDELPKINKLVAIKRILRREDEQDKQGFLSEIKLLTSCNHPNIVSLLGFSREDDEMILVYEYAFKGSLSDYLRRNCKMINLTWVQRIQICLDIAHGINYIHTDMKGKPRIIHRDIKSENILLDENLHAKVADFGLSTFHPMRQQASTIYTQNIVGTTFYMDPEYLKTHKYKRESDIYSFGVVLFEVLSGSLAYDAVYTAKHEKGLAHIARRCFNEGTIKELIDPKMIQEDDDLSFTLNRGPNQTSFNTFSEVAYRCLAETQAKRPTMEVVIKELQKALELQGETMVLLRFQLSDIVLATKNSAATYCIGLDTDRKVYKAELDHVGNSISSSTEGKHNGEPSKKHITVAIKCIINRKGGGGREAFFEELEMRTSYKHPNIVSLIGFCYEVDRMILVYEHASKSSLDDYLKSADNMKNFTWTHRLHMCLEIARGLNHLHTKIVSQERLFHGDIKSANILLGMNCEAKIAYFGISKHPMNQELGKKVYADPDYETTGKLERHSDIYSFGVVLFEILCGRVAYSPIYMKHNEKGLAPIARKCFNDGTIERIIDPKLMEETDEDIFTSNRGPNFDSLNTFLKVACQCLGEAVERPTMEMVINELEIALNFHEILLKKLQISLNDIKSATENFSEKNCVGSDKFCKAYKGELPFPLDNANASGRTTIVAKRWDNNFAQVDHQFRTEFNILFKRKHKNVISLVGYCHEMHEKIIVLEHMSRGSLDRYLKDANLTWMKRIEICIDIASGLEFLHHDVVMPKKVVHRNIRSASILLNDDWKAKISNLKSSSYVSLHQDMEHVSGNAYTAFGYLDPQHKQGFLTEKSDIYSFGVVLFEILCGRLAWTEDCKDHTESLGPLAKRFYEDGKVDEIVFEGIKEQLAPESLSTFAGIAYQCLHDKSEERPTARELVIQLKKVLDVQKDYEIWETQLLEDYKEIIQMSKTPEIYLTAKRKDLYDTLSKGILIQEGKVWFSLGNNGERNEIVSSSKFSYENHWSHKWCSVPESRFDKVAELLDISNLNMHIEITSRSLSSGINYGVHLVFKFHGVRKNVAKRMYVNLTYKMGNETLHAYFATWREDEWMTIELYRFLNHKESDTTNFEFLIKSFSRCYCGKRAVYVEGVELRAIDNVKPEENTLMQVQQVPQSTLHMNQMQQLPTNDIPFDICSIITQTLFKLFMWTNKAKQYYMLSANEALCDSFNAKLFKLNTTTKSRFQKVAELLSTQVFRIKCKIENNMLLQNTAYSCYLVFKLSEKRYGLHCPVTVRDLHQQKNKQGEVVYFESPKPWNIVDVNRVPQEREDGWMEVCVWKFKSNNELQNDCISINLKFVNYEGTMSGLIVCGLEFRPM